MSATPTVVKIVGGTVSQTVDSSEVLFAKTGDGFFQMAWRHEGSERFQIRYVPSGSPVYRYIDVISERHEDEDTDPRVPTEVIITYQDATRAPEKFQVKYAKTRDGFFQMARTNAAGKFSIRYYPSSAAGYEYVEVESEENPTKKKKAIRK